MSRGEGGSASGASERCSAGGHRFSVFQALSPLELFYTVEPQSVVLLFSGRASLRPSRQAPNRPLPTPAASASLCRCRGAWAARWQKRKPRRFLAAAIGMGVGVWRQRKKRRGIAGLFRGFVACAAFFAGDLRLGFHFYGPFARRVPFAASTRHLERRLVGSIESIAPSLERRKRTANSDNSPFFPSFSIKPKPIR